MVANTLDYLPTYPISCSRTPYRCECSDYPTTPATSLATTPSPTVPFTTLAPEIRLQIWGYVIGRPVITADAWEGEPVDKNADNDNEKASTSFPMFLTCMSRETRAEVLSILNRGIHIEIDTRYDLSSLDLLHETWRGMIRRIRITLVWASDEEKDNTDSNLLHYDEDKRDLLDVLPSLRSVEVQQGMVDCIQLEDPVLTGSSRQ